MTQLPDKTNVVTHEIPAKLVPDMVKFQAALELIYGKSAAGLNFDWKHEGDDIIVKTYWKEPEDLLKELQEKDGAIKEEDADKKEAAKEEAIKEDEPKKEN
ncbi:hypothetical protein BHE90_001394 [Fusarium euwallaceae]|uniref:Uncharacterized protein n=4 Tax=Fusarium solani species complex TaxID=232080 RepID=A0A3M2SCZ8_9HYPO|nr:hypothetical protein CDV36_004837 [Fusarium kuroshium]RSL89620.1 hypothetical protein CEP51_001119 [Fusarium floridanum]RSL94769.1 hypothetical protein CEP52_012434 [Fusarium oligoseptatum]RTE84007.1 hypothetical protein BHE90_001394 [Fusarium euwallaceae]